MVVGEEVGYEVGTAVGASVGVAVGLAVWAVTPSSRPQASKLSASSKRPVILGWRPRDGRGVPVIKARRTVAQEAAGERMYSKGNHHRNKAPGQGCHVPAPPAHCLPYLCPPSRCGVQGRYPAGSRDTSLIQSKGRGSVGLDHVWLEKETKGQGESECSCQSTSHAHIHPTATDTGEKSIPLWTPGGGGGGSTELRDDWLHHRAHVTISWLETRQSAGSVRKFDSRRGPCVSSHGPVRTDPAGQTKKEEHTCGQGKKRDVYPTRAVGATAAQQAAENYHPTISGVLGNRDSG